MGRSKGSKDKVSRQPRGQLNVSWEYGGKKGVAGTHFAVIGDEVTHDVVGKAFIVAQPNPSSLVLQIGEGDDSTIASFASRQVQGLVHEQGQAIGREATSATRGKHQSGLKRNRSQELEGDGQFMPKQVVTKAEAEEARKRKKREATAAAKGKPLKIARAQKNRTWEAALKQQAVELFNAKYAHGMKYGDCVTELAMLPGFNGVTRANVKYWVEAAAKRAEAVPNELGLVVHQQGRPPTLPSDMYDELKAQLVALAQTKAFTINSTTLRPIVLAFVIKKLGPAGRCDQAWSRWFCVRHLLAEAAR